MLTLSKAAQLAQTPVDQFVSILGSAGVSVIGYDVQELEQELNQF
ncbi:MAG: UPF0175 family protein [Gammaproteobacteria bacterium]|nr:UPF0175 family protein [Gammaproteobacteria bacterium]